MSLFVQASAFLPAIVAIIVVIAAIADRREANALSDLSALDHGAASADDAEHGAGSVAA